MHAPHRSNGPITADRGSGEWRRGWPALLAAAVGYGTGGAMLMLLGSLFIKPMRDDLGWSVTAVTIMPVVSLVWALSNPVAGAAIDRFGSRSVAILGMLGIALCASLLAVMPVTRAGLLGTAGSMGVFASMTSVATYSRGVATWFKNGFGLALGLALSGSAGIAIIATPLVGMAIASFGWRAGYLALAALILFIALPLVALFYRERVDIGSPDAVQVQATGADLAEAIRDTRFWCYASSFALACCAVAGTATHLQPLLADKAIALPEALALGVAFAVAISLGKVIGGLLLDRIWPFGVSCAISLLAGAGALGLTAVSEGTPFPLLALTVGAIGLATGAEADFVGFFVIRSFGMRKFSTIVGLLAMIVTLGNALGGWVYGLLFDLYGSYDIACLFGAGCLAASGIVILFAGAHENRARTIEKSAEVQASTM